MKSGRYERPGAEPHPCPLHPEHVVSQHFPSYLQKDAEYTMKGKALKEIEVYTGGKFFPLPSPITSTREEYSEFIQRS